MGCISAVQILKDRVNILEGRIYTQYMDYKRPQEHFVSFTLYSGPAYSLLKQKDSLRIIVMGLGHAMSPIADPLFGSGQITQLLT